MLKKAIFGLALVTILGVTVLGVTILGALSGPAQARENGQLAALPVLKPDRLVVLKSERKLVLMRGDRVLKVYNVALGRYPEGAKKFEGDAKTPEGSYTIDYRLRQSAFYRAIHISYPNAQDRARARLRGESPGGRIMIHGLANGWTARQIGHPWLDWTQGCIAVTNREMDEIWKLVDLGTPIEIHP